MSGDLMSKDEIVITFPRALPGFPGLSSFRIFEPEGSYPLKFLQSVDSPDVSFTCMDAATVKLDYQVPLGPEDAAILGLGAPEESLVLVMVVVPDRDARRMKANLAGPLVINTRTRVGLQIQLDTRTYPLEHPVFLTLGDAPILFSQGLIGFPELKRYSLLEPNGAYPFKFLQSSEREDISFVCMDVAAIQPDYQVDLGEEEARSLALEDPADALVLALVVIPEDPRNMTANLAGPLLINLKTLQGRQLVLNTERFPLKFPVFADR